jgi:hypothetical protein
MLASSIGAPIFRAQRVRDDPGRAMPARGVERASGRAGDDLGNGAPATPVGRAMKTVIAALIRLAKSLAALEARTALRPVLVPVRK